MLTNIEIGEITRNGLVRVLSQDIIYKYVGFETGFEKIIQGKTLKPEFDL